MRKLIIAAAVAALTSPFPAPASGSVGGEAMFEAAKAGDVAEVRRHIRQGASPDEKDWSGAPLIMRAACHGRMDVIRYLAQSGANLNARQGGAWTALHCAARYDELETVIALIELGADPSLKDEDGDTLADTARQGGAWSVVRYLEGGMAQEVPRAASEMNCGELERHAGAARTQAYSASMERGKSPLEQGRGAHIAFAREGALRARRAIDGCPGAKGTYLPDGYATIPCAELREKETAGFVGSMYSVVDFGRNADDTEAQGQAFAELSTMSYFFAAAQEVLRSRGCRQSTEEEFDAALKKWLNQ